GLTRWNVGKRFQGHTNVALSDEGRAQAQALVGAFAGDAFDVANASDLDRAMETARIALGTRPIAPIPDARLREFDFGAWEGLTWDEISARWPELRDRGSTVAKLYRPHDGESFEDVTARVAAFLSDLRGRSHERVLVVTHAGVLHAVLAALGSGLEDRRGDALSLTFSPLGITRIAMEGDRSRLITLNDVSHLTDRAR
ncbi:MAG: histidine phosphatase family protein, partial [Vulcanimicrobiaceae bacterium]